MNYLTIRKRFLVFVLFLGIFLTLLSGCRMLGPKSISDPSEGNIISLWVVTELTNEYGMNSQVKTAIEEFENAQGNVDIRLDILPTDDEERAIKLEQLRTEIMAGGGPDAYLLPSDSGINEPLFRDVMQSMHNGLFYDISEYYDADEALGKDAFVEAVMDAGVVDESRYILPLRYNLPAYYIDTEALAVSDLNNGIFESGILNVLDTVLEMGDKEWACGAEVYIERFGFNIYPNLINYESGEVSLNAYEVAEFLEKYQAVRALIGDTYDHRKIFDVIAYIHDNYYWGNSGFPMHNAVIQLDYAMDLAATAKAEGKMLSMIPMRATDGSLIADVYYWCAVGSGSKNTELAYDFIRMFLLEDYQWEQNRENLDVPSPSLISKGWPVRVVGSVEPIWKIYREQISNWTSTTAQKNWKTRKSTIMQVELTNSDIPLLQEEIDSARFSIHTERTLYASLVYELNDSANGYVPTEVEINALAEDLIQELEWHVAEG